MYINFWYPADWSSALTDQPLRTRMLGQDLVLFRDGEGEAHCLSNTCIHRGGSLGDGKLRDGGVECPYHGWRFNAAGQCTRIPSLGKNASVPKRARIDAYPTVERYGLIFVFLGDLPEEERPPIMDVEPFGQPGWHATFQEFFAETDYRRQLENALDPAHNEFVHPTHGFSGARDDYFVPEITVENKDWGSGFLTTYFAPPLKDKKMKEATVRSENAVIEAGTFHHGPSSLLTSINPTKDHLLRQHAFKTPVDETSVRTFLIQMRNFLPGDEHDERFLERNLVVAGQDAVVLGEIHPPVTPETLTKELFMPADNGIARYRELMDEWEARGWRIDAKTVTRNAKKVAYAIPSPARRRDPKGWILDSVPMLPASQAEESTGVANVAS